MLDDELYITKHATRRRIQRDSGWVRDRRVDLAIAVRPCNYMGFAIASAMGHLFCDIAPHESC